MHLSQAESAIGQMGSSVQSLDAQVQQMYIRSNSQCWRELSRAEMGTEQLRRELQESRRMQEELYRAFEEQKAAIRPTAVVY